MSAQQRADTARLSTCAWASCQSTFLLCSYCNLRYRYCSRDCALRARRAGLRAAGQRYQRSRRGRFMHAARQARYRARRRERKAVTHPSPRRPYPIGTLAPTATPDEARTQQAATGDVTTTQDAADVTMGLTHSLTGALRSVTEARLFPLRCVRCHRVMGIGPIWPHLQNPIHKSRARPFYGRIFPQGADDSILNSSLFWSLWEQHEPYLHQQSLGLMGGNRADAKDALSMTMLRAVRRFRSYRPGKITNAKAWLSQILKNVCVDLYRERQRFIEPQEEESDAEDAPGAQLLEEKSPENEILAAERKRKILARIEELPPQLSKPLKMRFFEEQSYEEIATRMHLSNCNARKRVQLACDILRIKLADVR